ncbi:Co2+/Mg2+ efflux protein ApaG [Thioflexithrix psekupsensis]|uniref:Protein ApaG n=1 Tax=Thioflexithrix psekupsensis TaxID=1570016 RepID=A0A251X8E8_9GAMM|nr:Co2+/Mg2+ efflux protein ApaG [Thioflexithrix psekupsensis]OUD13812.1 Co2+/Mg2+ efflux protein ApaG [Thioflexithrix psekupsensis]
MMLSPYHIRVEVKTHYLSEQSSPEQRRYVFAYTVTLHNVGTVAARLLSRHWIITDANEQIQEVRGQGVVGEQPYLRPGERFEYTSATAIATPVGTMHGSYQMLADDGLAFDAEIPLFRLALPHTLH